MCDASRHLRLKSSSTVLLLTLAVALSHANSVSARADVLDSPETDPVPTSSAIDRALAFIGARDPGCAAAVYRRGVLVAARARGRADLENDVPLTTDSRFDIGSISKQFTAFAIGLLVEDGRLNLEDDIRKWVPELPAYNKPIRIRHLLHHTSGIREYQVLLSFSGVNTPDMATLDQVLALLGRQAATNFPPGSQFFYSNSNYVLLGVIVARASGQSLSDFARDRIFRPLGMQDSGFVDSYLRVVPGRARSYDPAEGGGWSNSISAQDLIGDGGVVTTLADLARWDGNFAKPIVGRAGALTLLTTPGTLDDGTPIVYGSGLVMDRTLGRRTQSHNGGWLGYVSSLRRFVDDSLTVAVLCNRPDYDPDALAVTIAQSYLPPLATPPLAEPATITLPPAQLATFAGTYSSDWEWRIVEVRDGQARLLPEGTPLDAIDADTLQLRDAPHRQLRFSADRKRLRIVRSFGAFELTRVAPVGAAALADYAGTYDSPETAANTIVGRDGQLQARARIERGRR